jgi:hypothetical protein
LQILGKCCKWENLYGQNEKEKDYRKTGFQDF